MSVLYKALERAAKIRQQAQAVPPEPTPSPVPPVGRHVRRSGSGLPVAGLAAAGSLAVLLCAFLAFGDDFLAALDALLPASPSPAVPASPPPAAKPAVPPVALAPAVPPAPAASIPAPTAPTATAPAASTATASTGPASMAPPPPPPAPSAAPPTASPAMPAPAAQPPASQALASPSPAPSAALANDGAVRADQDLPAVLDRIRNEKIVSAPSGRDVSVTRAGARTTTDVDGSPMISVSVQPSSGQDDLSAAYEHLLRGRYDQALRLYERILKASPRNLSALMGKAAALHKLQRIASARDGYRAVLAVDPTNREALANLIDLTADQEPERAVGDLRTLARTHPGFSPVPAQIAAIEAKRGDYAAAIDAMEEAVAMAPDNGLYRLNLAVLQDHAGRTEDAVRSYRAALGMLDAAGGGGVSLEPARDRLRFLQGR